VSEKRVLRRIFESKWKDVRERWRNLQSEELHNFQALPDIIRVMKSRKRRWVGHVACMGAM
jgi:SMC interacting uncharacterized protein involved in chromosome segregation